MTRIALATLLVFSCAAVASAGVPSVGNSTAPPCISLVGAAGGVPDHADGQFTVIILDLANAPVAGANVVVDLSGCPDLFLCADQRDPSVVVDCTQKRVSKHAQTDGSALFTILGCSNGTAATTLLSGGKIYGNGTLVGSPTVSCFDLDGANGVGINDLSVWLGDFGTPGNPAFGRSDFDCSGSVGINDLSVWLSAYGSGRMSESCASPCP